MSSKQGRREWKGDSKNVIILEEESEDEGDDENFSTKLDCEGRKTLSDEKWEPKSGSESVDLTELTLVTAENQFETENLIIRGKSNEKETDDDVMSEDIVPENRKSDLAEENEFDLTNKVILQEAVKPDLTDSSRMVTSYGSDYINEAEKRVTDEDIQPGDGKLDVINEDRSAKVCVSNERKKAKTILQKNLDQKTSMEKSKNKISGRSFIMGIRGAVEGGKTLFNCILCFEPSLESGLIGSVFNKHIKSREHALRVMEVLNSELYKKYKDSESSDDEVLDAILEYEDSLGKQNFMLATIDNYLSKRKEIEKKIKELKGNSSNGGSELSVHSMEISQYENDSSPSLKVIKEKEQNLDSQTPKCPAKIVVNLKNKVLEDTSGKQKEEERDGKVIYIGGEALSLHPEDEDMDLFEGFASAAGNDLEEPREERLNKKGQNVSLPAKIKNHLGFDDVKLCPTETDNSFLTESLRVLMVGDSRVNGLLRDVDRVRFKWTVHPLKGSKLGEMVKAVDLLLSKSEYDMLVLVGFHQDMIRDGTKNIPLRVNLGFSPEDASKVVSTAHWKWLEKYPDMNIVWTLPLVPDLIRYNEGCSLDLSRVKSAYESLIKEELIYQRYGLSLKEWLVKEKLLYIDMNAQCKKKKKKEEDKGMGNQKEGEKVEHNSILTENGVQPRNRLAERVVRTLLLIARRKMKSELADDSNSSNNNNNPCNSSNEVNNYNKRSGNTTSSTNFSNEKDDMNGNSNNIQSDSEVQSPTQANESEKKMKVFEKVVIIMSHFEKEELSEFASDKVLLFGQTDIKKNAKSLILKKMDEVPRNTLWLVLAGSSCIFDMGTCNYCHTNPSLCIKSLRTLSPCPGINNTQDTGKVVGEFEESMLRLLKEVREALPVESQVFLLPPFPVTVSTEMTVTHEKLHDLNSKVIRVYVSKNNVIGLMGLTFTRLSSGILSLTIKDIEDAKFCSKPFNEYMRNLPLNHMQIVNRLHDPLKKYVNKWKGCLSTLIKQFLNHPISPKTSKNVLNNPVSPNTDGNVIVNIEDDPEIIITKVVTTSDKLSSTKNLYDHLVFIGCQEQLAQIPLPVRDISLSFWYLNFPVDWLDIKQKVTDLQSEGRKNILFVILADVSFLGTEAYDPQCDRIKCQDVMVYFTLGKSSVSDKVQERIGIVKELISKIKTHIEGSKVVLAPLRARYCAARIDSSKKFGHNALHYVLKSNFHPCILEGVKENWRDAIINLKKQWDTLLKQNISKDSNQMTKLIEEHSVKLLPLIHWLNPKSLPTNTDGMKANKVFYISLIKIIFPFCNFAKENQVETTVSNVLQKHTIPNLMQASTASVINRDRQNSSVIPSNTDSSTSSVSCSKSFISTRNMASSTNALVLPSTKTSHSYPPIDQSYITSTTKLSTTTPLTQIIEGSRVLSDFLEELTTNTLLGKQFDHAVVVGKKEMVEPLAKLDPKNVTLIKYHLHAADRQHLSFLSKRMTSFPPKTVCCLAFNLTILLNKDHASKRCIMNNCKIPVQMHNLRTLEKEKMSTGSSLIILNRIRELLDLYDNLSKILPVVILPIFPSKIFLMGDTPAHHALSHGTLKGNCFNVTGSSKIWRENLDDFLQSWNNFIKSHHNKYPELNMIPRYPLLKESFFFMESAFDCNSKFNEQVTWDAVVKSILGLLLRNFDYKLQVIINETGKKTLPSSTIGQPLKSILKSSQPMTLRSAHNEVDDVPSKSKRLKPSRFDKIGSVGTNKSLNQQATNKKPNIVGNRDFNTQVNDNMSFGYSVNQSRSTGFSNQLEGTGFNDSFNQSGDYKSTSAFSLPKYNEAVNQPLSGSLNQTAKNNNFTSRNSNWNNNFKANSNNDFTDNKTFTSNNKSFTVDGNNSFKSRSENFTGDSSFAANSSNSTAWNSSNNNNFNVSYSCPTDNSFKASNNLATYNNRLEEKLPEVKVMVWNLSEAIPEMFFVTFFKTVDSLAKSQSYSDHYLVQVTSQNAADLIVGELNNRQIGDTVLRSGYPDDPNRGGPYLTEVQRKYVSTIFYKVYWDYRKVIVDNLRRGLSKAIDITNYKTRRCQGGCLGGADPTTCSYYHSASDRRRNPAKYKYEQKRCSFAMQEDANSLPNRNDFCHKGLTCPYAHNIYEQMFHPVNFQKVPCQFHLQEKEHGGSNSFCKFAHRGTPEMFYTNGWQDSVVFGTRNTLNYFVGAIRGLFKLEDSKAVKICVVSPSSEYLNVLQLATSSILQEQKLTSICLDSISRYSSNPIPENCQVFLGTPSAVATMKCDILSKRDYGAIIVDNIKEILENPQDGEYLLRIFQKLRSAMFGSLINKVFVAREYDGTVTGVTSRFLGFNLKEVTPRKPSTTEASQLFPETSSLPRRDPPPQGGGEEAGGVHQLSEKRRAPSSPPTLRKKRRDEEEDEEDTLYWKSLDELDQDSRRRFLDEERILKVALQERYRRLEDRPELHPEYESFYEEFLSGYETVHGRRMGVDHLKRFWDRYWANKVISVKDEEWKSSRSQLLKEFKERLVSEGAVVHGSGRNGARAVEASASAFRSPSSRVTPSTSSRGMGGPSNSYSVSRDTARLSSRFSSSTGTLEPSLSKSTNSRTNTRNSSRFSGSKETAGPAISTSGSRNRPIHSSRSLDSRDIVGPTNRSYGSRNTAAISEEFSVEATLSLLEKLSGRLGVMGVTMSAIISSAKEKGVGAPACLAVFREEDNVTLINLVLDKMKSVDDANDPLLGKAVSWTERLLELAKTTQERESLEQGKTGLNLMAIAEASKGKDSEFTINLIKTALAYEGHSQPSLLEINDLYLKICSIHFEMTMQNK